MTTTTTILTEQDAVLLNQAIEMLEEHSAEQRRRGNCSTAEAAECSAHAVQRLGVAMLAAQRGAQPAPAAQSLESTASILLRVIQRLNQNPYSLTKSECITLVQEMRDEALCATEAAPSFEQRMSDWQHGDALDAARWREVLMHVGAARILDDGGQHFTISSLRPLSHMDLMRGSVAQHFIKCVDASAQQRSASAAQGE